MASSIINETVEIEDFDSKDSLFFDKPKQSKINNMTSIEFQFFVLLMVRNFHLSLIALSVGLELVWKNSTTKGKNLILFISFLVIVKKRKIGSHNSRPKS